MRAVGERGKTTVDALQHDCARSIVARLPVSAAREDGEGAGDPASYSPGFDCKITWTANAARSMR
jgi:hypothetical protein